MRYHITPDGPKPCRASVKPCKYSEGHFDSLEQANEAFAKQFENELMQGIRGNSDGEKSAEVSRGYAHWAIIHDHLHNAADMGNEAEILYYSSPQGLLELERRKRSGLKDYFVIERKLNEEPPPDFSYELDEKQVNELITEGERQLHEDSSFITGDYVPHPKENDPLRHFLAERSYEWMKRLTPKEQEAISWLTSNGFGMLQYAYGYRTEQAGHYFKGLVDEDAIWDKYHPDYDRAEQEVEKEKERIAQEYKRIVIGAFHKAPKLDSPKVIMRGTSLKELEELVGEQVNGDYKNLMDRIEAGEYSGKNTASGTRLSTIPQSATVRVSTAMNFSRELFEDNLTEDREVILAIKGRSFASPVNVGAWGSAEYEVFTNPLSSYRITGGERRGSAFVLELEELD